MRKNLLKQQFLSVPEVAELTGMSRATITQEMIVGSLRSFIINTHSEHKTYRRTTLDNVLQWLGMTEEELIASLSRRDCETAEAV
jgi:hypothetical protein